MTRLFLLEDDEALAEALAWALEKNDFAVTRAATMAEARKLLAGGEFALLVLDVGLPDGSTAPNTRGRTYAELADGEKDAISHRGRAMAAMAQALPDILAEA